MSSSLNVQKFYQDRRVCVTGGAGFIGSHLCEALTGLGAVVTVIDDLSNGQRENLEAAKIRFIQGSILDPTALHEAIDGAEVVFHEAALASVPRSVVDPKPYYDVNAGGTFAVLEAMRFKGVKRIVYAASSSVYGDLPQLPKHEGMVPQPMSPYASTKYAGEHLIRTYCKSYGMSGVSLRYFNVFGPRQRADSPYAAVIPKFADAMLAGEKPVIFGDGTQTRDFTHVSNVVHGNLLAGACAQHLEGDSINIACGDRFSLLYLLQTMAGILNVKADCEFAPPRIAEVQHSQADIRAAHELIGYEPITTFEEGLRRTLAWFKAQKKADRAIREA